MAEENPAGARGAGQHRPYEPLRRARGQRATAPISTVRFRSRSSTEDGEVLDAPPSWTARSCPRTRRSPHFQHTGEHLGIFENAPRRRTLTRRSSTSSKRKCMPATIEAGDQGQEQPSQGDYADPGGYAAGERGRGCPTLDPNIPYGRQIIERIFPGVVHVTEDRARSEIAPRPSQSRQLPQHDCTNAVDVRPSPWRDVRPISSRKLSRQGHEIVEARDEVNPPSVRPRHRAALACRDCAQVMDILGTSLFASGLG
jgi:hypothetical protein